MTRISETLRGIICRQENNLENYDKDQVVAAIKESKKNRVQHHQNIQQRKQGTEESLKITAEERCLAGDKTYDITRIVCSFVFLS